MAQRYGSRTITNIWGEKTHTGLFHLVRDDGYPLCDVVTLATGKPKNWMYCEAKDLPATDSNFNLCPACCRLKAKDQVSKI